MTACYCNIDIAICALSLSTYMHTHFNTLSILIVSSLMHTHLLPSVDYVASHSVANSHTPPHLFIVCPLSNATLIVFSVIVD